MTISAPARPLLFNIGESEDHRQLIRKAFQDNLRVSLLEEKQDENAISRVLAGVFLGTTGRRAGQESVLGGYPSPYVLFL